MAYGWKPVSTEVAVPFEGEGELIVESLKCQGMLHGTPDELAEAEHTIASMDDMLHRRPVSQRQIDGQYALLTKNTSGLSFDAWVRGSSTPLRHLSVIRPAVLSHKEIMDGLTTVGAPRVEAYYDELAQQQLKIIRAANSLVMRALGDTSANG